jgi:ATP-dependent protease Clp ATPase subunit
MGLSMRILESDFYVDKYFDKYLDDMYASVQENVLTFLDNVSFIDFYNAVKRRVVGHDAELKKACYYVYSYLVDVSGCTSAARNKKRKHFMIAGKSGCGKTEFARALVSVFERFDFRYDVLIINSSSITPEGYRGVSFNQVLEPVYAHDEQGHCIVFLDEIDKRMLAARSGGTFYSLNDYFSLLDGDGIRSTEISHDDHDMHFYPTNKMLFIGMGAFDALRSDREAKISNIGFMSDTPQATNVYSDDITLSDMVDSGCSPEFVGRFADVINFRPLTDDGVDTILMNHLAHDFQKPDNVPIRNVHVRTVAMKQFIDIAHSKRGIRAMLGVADSIITDCLLESGYYPGETHEDISVTIESVEPVKVSIQSSGDDNPDVLYYGFPDDKDFDDFFIDDVLE